MRVESVWWLDTEWTLEVRRCFLLEDAMREHPIRDAYKWKVRSSYAS